MQMHAHISHLPVDLVMLVLSFIGSVDIKNFFYAASVDSRLAYMVRDPELATEYLHKKGDISRAFKRNREDLVMRLLQLDTVIPRIPHPFDHPLPLAVQKNYIAAVQKMWEREDVFLNRFAGHAAFIIAVHENRTSCLRILLTEPTTLFVNLQHHSEDQSTFLHIAVSLQYVDTVKVLLDVGADVQLLDKNGKSCLFEACAVNNEELVSLLLAAPGILNVIDIPAIVSVDGHFHCALHEAVRHSNVSICEKLLLAGANVNVLDSRQNKPQTSNREIQEVLLRYGGA